MGRLRKSVSCLLVILLMLHSFGFGPIKLNSIVHARDSVITMDLQTEDDWAWGEGIISTGKSWDISDGTDLTQDWLYDGILIGNRLISNGWVEGLTVADAVYGGEEPEEPELPPDGEGDIEPPDEEPEEPELPPDGEGDTEPPDEEPEEPELPPDGEGDTEPPDEEPEEPELPPDGEADTTPPTVPQNLTAGDITRGGVTLSWNASTDDYGVEGYMIYRDDEMTATVTDSVYYHDTGLTQSTEYTYEVAAYDAAGNVSERSQPLQVRTLEEAGNGIGLMGQYYNGTAFQEIIMERIDETIDFHWAGVSPHEALDPKAFTVRWTGKVQPRYSEEYTFYTRTHGGIRLWVDDRLLTDDWGAHNMNDKSARITLDAGKKYNIRMEYCETNGLALARLQWSSPSQSKEIIPACCLYPPVIPDVPKGIDTQSTSTTITVTWNEADDAEGYDIESDGKVIDNGASTIYTHTGLEPDTIHEYRVRSKASGITSPWSIIHAETTKIGVPKNISVAAEDDKVVMTWDGVPGATGYEIESDGQVTDVGQDTTYVHGHLMPNTHHTYRVRAVNHNGPGDWSGIYDKMILSDKPVNLNAAATHNSITLSWDPVPEALGYEVEADGTIVDNGTDTVYIHRYLAPNTVHAYRVRAIKTDGPKDWSELLVKSTLPEPGSGTGLKGEYYDDQNLTDHKHSRVEQSIDFDWKNNSPAPGIEASEFSVRWTGQVEPRFSEIYTLYIQAHGGIKLWVDGKLLIDDWGAHNMIRREQTIAFDKGEKYDIKLEYRESNGIALARLSWSSGSQDKEIIPKSQLYPIGVLENISTTAARTSIEVEWDEVSFATGYDIEADSVIHDIGLNTQFTHSGLVPGTRHTYRVRARNGIVTGHWSSSVSETTLLGKPENILMEASETTVTMSWEPVYGAAGYDVEVDGTVINNGQNTVYIHDGLTPGTLHSYRVRARSSAVTGGWTSLQGKWTLPDIPGNIDAASTGSSITVTWDPVTGATGYEVEVYGTPVDTGENTWFLHDGLNPNMQHTYRVRAKNESGCGKWSRVIAKTTLPGAPMNIAATPQDTSITVTWDEIAGALSYDIEVDGELITGITDTGYLHSGLMPNTTHAYRVRAVNPEGMSEWSPLITQTTLPSIPSGLTAVVTGTDITLSWDEIEGATGYDIEADGMIVENVSETTYLHTGLETNTQHTYRVRSRKGQITSPWSQPLTVITLPGCPENLQGTARSDEITVSWDPVAGATGYDIEVDGVIIDNGLNNSYIHTGLEPNTQHAYRVRARNISGPGDWSETITVATSLEIPIELTATVDSTSIMLSWSPVANATGYDVLVDGEIIHNGTGTVFIHTGLEPNSWHVYRVRARNGECTGGWSQAITVATLVGIPQIISVDATSTQVTIMWQEVSGATGYDVKVDDRIIDSPSLDMYIHQGLEPNTLHTYRVRAKNENGPGGWSELLEVLTSPGIPENLTATATTTEIMLSWDGVDGSVSYDVEADGTVIEDIEANTYLHGGLEPNTWHAFRVRSKNESGTSEWSQPLQKNTNPEIAVNAGKDNMFDFVVVAPEKEGANTRYITVTYNPDELEVLDLCTAISETVLTTGDIEGTDISVEEFTPGSIKYRIDNADKTITNSIRFQEKVNGYSKIVYMVE